MSYDTKQEVYLKLKQGLEKTINHLYDEFGAIRAGRANPKILDRVMVSYYGNLTPINQIANISVPEARMLVINVWDNSILKDTVKAIQEANLGVYPSDDGKVIRLVFPALTEDRRKEFCKNVRKICEDTKVGARNERRIAIDNIKAMKKDNKISEDEEISCEKEIQKILDDSIIQIDKISKDKEKEIMDI